MIKDRKVERKKKKRNSSSLTKSIRPGCYRLPFVQTYEVIPQETSSASQTKFRLLEK